MSEVEAQLTKAGEKLAQAKAVATLLMDAEQSRAVLGDATWALVSLLERTEEQLEVVHRAVMAATTA